MLRLKRARNCWREGGELEITRGSNGQRHVVIRGASWMVAWEGALIRSVTPTGEIDEDEGVEWFRMEVSHNGGETWFAVTTPGIPEVE